MGESHLEAAALSQSVETRKNWPSLEDSAQELRIDAVSALPVFVRKPVQEFPDAPRVVAERGVLGIRQAFWRTDGKSEGLQDGL